MIRSLHWIALLGCVSCSGPAATTQSRPSTPRPVVRAETAEPVVVGRRTPTSLEQGVIDRLVVATEQTRALRFQVPVHVDIESATRIAESLMGQVTDEEVSKALNVYQTLGLLAPGTDVRALLESVLSEQVVGYYDPDDKRLVVREDIMRTLVGSPNSQEATFAKLTLLHELVHALQDQWLGLGEEYGEDRDSDVETAYRSVAEGDAMLAMVVNMAATAGAPIQTATTPAANHVIDLNHLGGGGGMGSSAVLDDVPPILRVTLIAPYLLGLRMAARQFNQGGWDAVNDLFVHPPLSTEQLLHPERFRQDAPIVITTPDYPSLEAAGYTLLDEDTLGELELSVYLAQHVAADVNASAASGWAGDRLAVFEHEDGEHSVVWFLAFDDEEEAQEAGRAAEGAAGNAGLVRVDGRGLLILRHVPEDLQAEPIRLFHRFAQTLQTGGP